MPRTTSRRSFLRAGLGVAAAGLSLGTAEAAGPDFSFLSINDTHWLNEECTQYHKAAFASLRRRCEYDFVLLCGDLATAGKRHEFEGLREAFPYLGARVYPVMGNHDWAEGKQTWIDVFGTRRFNYRFDYHGWTFLGLDTTDEAKYQDVVVQPDTVAWIERTLVTIPAKRPIVAFSHMPFGPDVAMRVVNADDVLGLFSGHNLVHIFSGHFHGITERAIGSANTSTCACLSHSRDNHDGTQEKGCFLATVQRGKLTHEFVEYDPDA